MQESLLNTINDMQEDRVNVQELEVILNSDIENIVSLCKKAYLKPKTDSMGNAYFTSEDVNVLKKMKALYEQSKQAKNSHAKEDVQENVIETAKGENLPLDNPDNKINFLTKAKNRIKESSAQNSMTVYPSYQIKNALDKMENSLISKMSEILSEKMDGFDEIIVELIRAKTENENLRQQVNSLNKQMFILKKELSAFSPIALNIYIKKDIEQ